VLETNGYGKEEIEDEEHVDADMKEIGTRVIAATGKDVPCSFVHLPIVTFLLLTCSFQIRDVPHGDC